MRYYISGQITNNPIYLKDFENAEIWLKVQHFEVINPTKIGVYDFFSYAEYMKIDLFLLAMCDGIYMLNNWEKSKGAKTELAVAKSLGKKIMFETKNSKKQTEQLIAKIREQNESR